MKKLYEYTEKVLKKLDNAGLWLCGFAVIAIVFLPYVFMGESSVFVWHDQLDENLLHYIIPARHIGESIREYPEMMGGINKSALMPYGILFVPLYALLDSFKAFVLQYLIVFIIAFGGMYALVKHVSKSSVISLLTATLFAMLPFYPVYGASVAAIPMVLYSIILLEKKQKLFLAYFILVLYATTSSLFFTGYAVLGFWSLRLIWLAVSKRINRHSIIGYLCLIVIFVFINFSLVLEFLFPSYGFKSSRQEYVANSSGAFFKTFINMFVDGGSKDAMPLAKYIVVFCLVLLIAGFVLRNRLSAEKKEVLGFSGIVFIMIVFSCIFAAFFTTDMYTDFKNANSGFLHSFQIDRFSWLLPGLWWIEFGSLSAVFWPEKETDKRLIISCMIFLVVLIPSAVLIKNNSYLHMSINQKNNGSSVTGYISWEAYYADDVMEDIETAIGKDISSYRVAHLGMSPAPSLKYGFYTVDGYANSYPLEYKHSFRKIIAKEIEKDPDVKRYFDEWGSRCYLFNSQSGTVFMIGKDSNAQYKALDFSWEELKNLGAEYIFSAGEIADFEECNLSYIGYFSSDTSYWGIYVYELD